MVVFEYQSFLWNESVRRYLEATVPTKDRRPLKYQAGVLVFPGTGIQENLADKAKKFGIPVWRFGATGA